MHPTLLPLKYPRLRSRRSLLKQANLAISKPRVSVAAPAASDPVSPEALRRPTLAPWASPIQKMVEADAELPPRLQAPARAIWRELQTKHGYSGCYNVVQEYVRSLRRPEAVLASLERSKKIRAIVAEQATAVIANSTSPLSTVISPTRVVLVEPNRGTLDADTANQWMKAMQQGAIPTELLSVEIPSISIEQIGILRQVALGAELAMRKRAMAMLCYMRGVRREQLCDFLGISLGSFWRYWRVFRHQGAEPLLVRKARSDRQSNNADTREAVFALLHSPPSSHGVNRTSWTMPTLESVLRSQGVAANQATISKLVKESGFQWKHARIVLTSADPEYREKVDAIKSILATLADDEAFFSIDEYGPISIRPKGGKKRVPRDAAYTVPQNSKSKGWFIVTAALDLSRNQITHFYSPKKNTTEIIRMADVLREKYKDCKTLYLSWDAASWHMSKALGQHIEQCNDRATVDARPLIKVAPLPSGSQFLNVIESIFSGLARAVIHNSDYPTVEAARAAVDQHLADRNEHYRVHPARAGKSIWSKERVPSIFSEANNCKDPIYQFVV